MSYVSGIVRKGIICFLCVLLICSLSACKNKNDEGESSQYSEDEAGTVIDDSRGKGYTEEEAMEMAEHGTNYFVKSGDLFYPLSYARKMWHGSSFDWEDGYMTPEGSDPIDPPILRRDNGDELVYFYGDDPGMNFFVTRLTDMNFTIPLQMVKYDDEETAESYYHYRGYDMDDVAYIYSETDDEELEIPLDRIKMINDRDIKDMCDSPEVEYMTGDELYEYSPSDQAYDEYNNGGKDGEYSLYEMEYKDTEIYLLKCDQDDKVKILYQDGAEDREIMARARTRAFFTFQKDLEVFAGEEDTGTYQTIDVSELSNGTYSICTRENSGNILWLE